MSANLKHIVAIILLVVLVGGLYYVASSGSVFVGYEDRADNINTKIAALERDLIEPLRVLSTVDLNEDIFYSIEFESLANMSEPLPVPALQRPNPFAPVQGIVE